MALESLFQEPDPFQLAVSLVAGLVAGAFLAWDARRHGRSPVAWGLAGLFFGIFGVVAWLLVKRFHHRPAVSPAEVSCAECRKPLSPDLDFCAACGAPRAREASSRGPHSG